MFYIFRVGSVSTHSLPNGLDPSDLRIGKHVLSADEIIDKYGEAVVHYGKVSKAGLKK